MSVLDLPLRKKLAMLFRQDARRAEMNPRQWWHSFVTGHEFHYENRTSYYDEHGVWRVDMPQFGCACGFGWAPYAPWWQPTRLDEFAPYTLDGLVRT